MLSEIILGINKLDVLVETTEKRINDTNSYNESIRVANNMIYLLKIATEDLREKANSFSGLPYCSWNEHDIIDLAHCNSEEVKITNEQARDFLIENRKYLEQCMVSSGWDFIESEINTWMNEKITNNGEKDGNS